MIRLTVPATVVVKNELLSKAASIYQYTHISVSSLIEAFDEAKAKRGNPRGVLPDKEQDILRAALVMSCAGVDAVLKQVIRDTLEALLAKDKKVREGFETFIHRRIGGESDVLEIASGARFLARILADSEPRKKLIEDYIRDLTGDSLQSAEEILTAAAALGIDLKLAKPELQKLKDIFGIRNKIIHELDIDLSSRQRKRRVRSQADLLENSDSILGVLRAFVEAVDARI